MNAQPDLTAYLRRTGYEGSLQPTLPVLAGLMRSHVAALPFENIDALAGRVPALDLASLQRKLVHGGRGGWCFEHNALFEACLRGLGFETEPMAARVRMGVPTDVMTGRTHMALRVALDGRRYLVDVGFGAMTPDGPVPMDGPTAEAGEPRDRLVPAGADLLLQHRVEAEWRDAYCICHAQALAVDFELGNWFVATYPRAMLRNNLLVSRAIGPDRLSLLNTRLTLRYASDAPPRITFLSSRSEFADALRDAFGLSLDTADIDAVRRVALEASGPPEVPGVS